MSTDVTSISALFRANSMDSVQNTGKDSAVQNDFSSFMNLNTYKQNTGYQIQNNVQKQNPSSGNTADVTEYEKYQYQKSNVVKDASEKTYSEEELKTVNDKLNEFSENVKTILKEELTVTDEQIENAMAVLQMNFADLMEPQNLTALVAELTGCEDSMQLLVADGFQNVLNGVEEITEQLLEELGMTKEQFVAVCNEMLNVDVPEDTAALQNTVENEIPDTETGNTSTQASENAKTAVLTEAADAADEKILVADESKVQMNTADETVANRVGETEDASQMQTERENLPENTSEEGNLPENTSEDETENSTDLFEKSDLSAQDRTENHGIVFEQNVQTVNNSPVSNAQQPVQAYVDVNNIIEQISEYTRVMVSGDTTSLEMQLNPENLGKIYIHVAEKAGTITAQITATNESVKEALQAQVVDLRESLNQQGIKVDAVEVTIESHEFEQNLEQNARQEQENAEQTEKNKSAGGRRNINLNDLDSLSGVMSEEESLVARMMQDNGNQMDVTA